MAMSRMADQVGRVLGGRYRLIAPIGAGASAQVYLAEDVVLRRRVAVKLLHAALAGDDGFLRRFQAEARAAAALSHPHVMAVYDWGEGDDGPFLVLELLSGGSLRALLDTGYRLSPSQALLMGLHAARGLDYAHRRGLVHRDIKPANLLFDEESRLRIADFGVARALAEAAWTEPTGAVIGSARYASPEQAQGHTLDGRSDVYSLALVLVEAVTGRVPFSADTTIATLMARVDAPYVAAPALGPLGPVIEHAAWPDPAARLDAAGLAEALEEIAPELDRPRPLPVGEAVAATLDLTMGADPDPTMLAPAGAPRAELTVHDASTAAAAAAVTGLAPTTPRGPVPPPDGGPRRHRRWPLRVLLVALLLVALGGMGFAVAQALIPTRTVPNVVGADIGAAASRLRALHFRVNTVHDRADGTRAGQVLGTRPAAGSRLKEGRTVRVVVSDGPTLVTVPDVKGLDRQTAIARLDGLGLKVSETGQRSATVPKGQILSASNAGSRLPKGSTVAIVTSEGPPTVTVPDESGRTFAQAQAELGALGLNAVELDDFSDAVQVGQVFATDPPANTAGVEVGATVTVKVSKGPLTITVPDVTGRKVDQAIAVLQQAGLVVTGVFGPHGNSGRVIVTSPQAGTRVNRGSGVVIYTT